MINHLAIAEQTEYGGILLFLMLGLLVIVFLAYLPRKEKPEKHNEDIYLADDNEDTDADKSEEANNEPDYDALKKKLYSAITVVFDDTLNNEGNIIIYSAAENNRFDEPIVSVITILLPNNMLYIKFNYNLDSNHIVQKYGDCVVKLDTENQSADIYTEQLHPNKLKDIIELAVAINELMDCGMTVILEV